MAELNGNVPIKASDNSGAPGAITSWHESKVRVGTSTNSPLHVHGSGIGCTDGLFRRTPPDKGKRLSQTGNKFFC